MRPTLQNGDSWIDSLANAAGRPILDGADEYGHGDKIPDQWLADESDQIKARFYGWLNRVRVVLSTGLSVTYTGATVVLTDGSTVSLAPGSLTLPASTNSFIFISETGAVTHATVLPALGVLLAMATTNASTVTNLLDLRYQVAERVGEMATGSGNSSGGFDIGDSKESSRANPGVGWVRHDHTLYAAADYPLAAAAIGTVHNLPGDPVGFFRVPPPTVVAVSAGTGYPLGSTGGSETVSLTAAQGPKHTHSVSESPHTHSSTSQHGHNTLDPGHGHPILASYETSGGSTDSLITENAAVAGETGGSFGYTTETWSNAGQRIIALGSANVSVLAGSANVSIASSRTNLSIQNTGDGQAHENRQPYYVCNKFIRLF